MYSRLLYLVKIQISHEKHKTNFSNDFLKII